MSGDDCAEEVTPHPEAQGVSGLTRPDGGMPNSDVKRILNEMEWNGIADWEKACTKHCITLRSLI
jgi:hypothetical protein